jgi:hypothetical protein
LSCCIAIKNSVKYIHHLNDIKGIR